MKLIDAIKQKGRPYDIPDCSRYDLPEFFKEMGYTRGVEIGVFKGDFTKCFAEAGLEIYGVDPWKAYGEYTGSSESRQRRMDFLYEHSRRTLEKYPNAHLIRKTSVEAAGDFKDGELDFVYIDGNHGFKWVAEDLWDWTKKVRSGGIIAGHDWALNKKAPRDAYCLHVTYVVKAFVDCFNIKNYYILGRYDYRDGEKRDKWRSWMWINP